MKNNAYLCPTLSTYLVKQFSMANLKKKIKEHGWTLEKVGKALDITKSSMTQVVSGNPTLKTLEAVAGVLGITVSELLREDDATPSGGLVCPHCGKAICVELTKGGEA